MAPVAALALGGHRYDEDAARSLKGLGMKGNKSYIKANFLPRLLLHAEVPVGRRGGGSRWRRDPNQEPGCVILVYYHRWATWTAGGCPNSWTVGAAMCCRLPRPGGAQEAMACIQIDLPAAVPAAQGCYSP